MAQVARRWLVFLIAGILALTVLTVRPPDSARADEDLGPFTFFCKRQDAGPPSLGCSQSVPWGSALWSINVADDGGARLGTIQIATQWGFNQGCVMAERFYPIADYVARQTGLAIHNCPGFLGISRTDVAVEAYRYWSDHGVYGTMYIYLWTGPGGTGSLAVHWRGPGCPYCHASVYG